MKVRLLVVVINYKTPGLTCEALDSLMEEIVIDKDRVVIVDNDSQDNSVPLIKKHIVSNGWGEYVDLVESGRNGGFSAGNNVGIASTNAQYYLLLNSDAFVREGAVQKMLDTMSGNASIGILGPRLEWPDGKQQVSCFYNLSIANSFLQSVKLGFFTRLFKKCSVNEVALPIEKHGLVEPEWLSFACVLLKGEMVRGIGLMDEEYFMYREDNDYCRRAVVDGWELKYEPMARVVHLNKGDSNQSANKRLPTYYFASRSRYFLKYYGRTGLLLANVLWAFGRGISLLREFVCRKPKAFHSSMLLDIWTGFFVKQGNDE